MTAVTQQQDPDWILISDEDWQACFDTASENGGGNLTHLNCIFEPIHKNSYELFFKTSRAGWDCCGVEAPNDLVIEAVKILGDRYGLDYQAWEECEKGYGRIYFTKRRSL